MYGLDEDYLQAVADSYGVSIQDHLKNPTIVGRKLFPIFQGVRLSVSMSIEDTWVSDYWFLAHMKISGDLESVFIMEVDKAFMVILLFDRSHCTPDLKKLGDKTLTDIIKDCSPIEGFTKTNNAYKWSKLDVNSMGNRESNQ